MIQPQVSKHPVFTSPVQFFVENLRFWTCVAFHLSAVPAEISQKWAISSEVTWDHWEMMRALLTCEMDECCSVHIQLIQCYLGWQPLAPNLGRLQKIAGDRGGREGEWQEGMKKMHEIRN